MSYSISKYPLSPDKYYPFQKNDNGKVKAQLTPNAKNEKRTLIYKIKDIKTGKCYIGKTGQGLNARVIKHENIINHQDDTIKSIYHKKIRENPNRFFIGILKYAENGEDLNSLEKYYIEKCDSFKNGYNGNRGGGGGEANIGAPTTPTKITLSKEEAKTPEKSWPVIVNDQGKIRVALTPSKRHAKGVVYGFKNKVKGKWLIGETNQEVRSRLSGYHSSFDHPQKPKGMLPLPKAIRKNPSHFYFYILDERGGNLKGLEKAWIAGKNSFENGYNQNSGGGGPSAAIKRKQSGFPENPIKKRLF